MQNQWDYTLKNGKSVVARQAVPEDAPAYLEYIDQVFQDDRFFLTTYEESRAWRSLEKVRERIAKFQDPRQGLILIALADNRVAGLADMACGEKTRIRHIASIGMSVLAQYRNIGLGTVMMQSLIDWAQRDPGVEKLVLSVYADNPVAVNLYRKMGFHEEGRQQRHYKFSDSRYVDSFLMAKFVK